MNEPEKGTEQAYMLVLLTEFVTAQQQMVETLSQVNSAIQILVSKELSDYEPKYKRMLTEYADFDWGSISAKPVAWDNDGFVISVLWSGHTWTRRCSKDHDTYGNTIRFNRTRKDNGKDIEYLDLIAFSEKGATIKPLSSDVLTIVKNSQKNKTSRPPQHNGKQVAPASSPALPSSNPERPNVSWPLQPSSRQPSSQETAVEDPVKSQKQAQLRKLIRDRGIPTDQVKSISKKRYGTDSSDNRTSEQIEEFYQHLSNLFANKSAPLPSTNK
jgi:hypothetical protein